MRIWLTGGSGALGQELIQNLISEYPEAELRYPTRTELNLEDFSKVQEFVGEYKPTHVFHLAARVFGVGGHSKSPEASLLANTRIDNSVFTSLFSHPPQWIYYASTVATYGFPYKELPLDESNFLQGSPHESEYGYAMSKRLGLSYLEILEKQHGVGFVYGLSTNLFGRGDRFLNGSGHVMVSLLKKANIARSESKALSVWGEPTSSRDFLSTKSAVKIITELVDQHIGVVNIASGQEITIESVAKIICQEFELTKGIEFTYEMQGIPNRVCSIRKLQNFSKFIEQVDSWKEIQEEIKLVANSEN